jgi:hypothetical protein
MFYRKIQFRNIKQTEQKKFFQQNFPFQMMKIGLTSKFSPTIAQATNKKPVSIPNT